MKRLTQLLLLPLVVLIALSVRTDAQQPLDWNQFRRQVLLYHPIARSAQWQKEAGAARLFSAKGAFDPKLYGDYLHKNFKGKEYYSHTETGVKWASWLGMEWKAGWNYASGVYLNPEEVLPGAGQATLGFSWNLLQGLMTDDRRAELKMARTGVAQENAAARSMVNDLLYDAAKSYWAWSLADQQVQLFLAAQQQAQMRHIGMVARYSAGDLPGIDTLESYIQWQNRQLDLTFAQNERNNALQQLANFLWISPDQPDPLPLQNVQSAPLDDGQRLIDVPKRDSLIQTGINTHPDLEWYRSKRSQLEVEQRLKKEQLKPVLQINYNLLGDGWRFFPESQILTKDMKWGAQFSYPVPNRKARGGVQLAQVKIAQTDLSIRQKQWEIENKIRQYANDLEALSRQIALYRSISNNYKILLEAENEKFKVGESSVFLINTREQRWIDAQVKYLKLWAEYRKAEAALHWATGGNPD